MDRNTILAFLVIGLIIILFPYYQEIVMPPSQQEAPQKVLPEKSEEPAVIEKREKRPPKKEIEEKRKIEESYEQKEKLITIDTDLYICVISTKGGTIKNWILKKYNKKDGSQLDLIKNNISGNLGVSFTTFDGDTINTGNMSFEPIEIDFEDSTRLTFGRSDQIELHLLCKIEEERYIEKILKFNKNEYPFNMGVKFTGLNGIIADREYWVSWGSALTPSEEKFEDDFKYSKIHAMMGDELETLDPNGDDEKSATPTGNTRWIALHSKYFAVAIMPDGFSGIEANLSGSVKKSNTNKQILDEDFYAAIKAEFNDEDVQRDDYKILIGPLEYPMITGLEVDLEKIMGFGWKLFRPISKLIYHTLRFLQSYIPNYGLVIIIFSILVKILFYPLTHKSYVSMKKMQNIQPLMKELREKHKKNPQKLNKAMMRLYKEHKVNPLGGCLPLLLQMPVFIAMYPLFYRMIEFRGAKFVWWINDLSSPDTVAQLNLGFMTWNLNILVLIWVASMFIQNKLTMKDPKQKMMVYLMPLMMLIFFNNLFSSGLVLYWTVFNVLTTIQQFLTKK